MADADFSLLIEHLKRIQDRLSRVEDKLDNVAADVRSVKTHMAGFMSNEVVQDAAIASLAARRDRVERRLDLRDDN